MDLFVYNISWMYFNALLAIVGMLLGYLMLKMRHKSAKVMVGIFWLLFIPNTIYMVTDLAHLTWQLPLVSLGWKAGILFQFLFLAVLGVVTFILGVYPFEKVLTQTKKFGYKHIFVLVFVALNLLIGFGVILGRVYRIHSWYVFTQPMRVVSSSVDLIISAELIVISLLIGTVGFIVYFLLRDAVVTWVTRPNSR